MAGKFDPNVHHKIVSTIRQHLRRQYPHLESFLETCDGEVQQDMLRFLRDVREEESVNVSRQRRYPWKRNG